jgi:hypothetical protein
VRHLRRKDSWSTKQNERTEENLNLRTHHISLRLDWLTSMPDMTRAFLLSSD